MLTEWLLCPSTTELNNNETFQRSVEDLVHLLWKGSLPEQGENSESEKEDEELSEEEDEPEVSV